MIVMNEQGAHFFDQYRDSSGTCLSGKEIGCWDEVAAEEASFASSTHGVAFSLASGGWRALVSRPGTDWLPPGLGRFWVFLSSHRQGIELHGQVRKTPMTSVLLIYPFFKPRRDRSVFRFPPLGISYIAASLRAAGHPVTLLDCTFEKNRNEALGQGFGRTGRSGRHLLHGDHVGRQLVVCRPAAPADPPPGCRRALAHLRSCPFLEHFDIVVRGEGEQTILDLLEAYRQDSELSAVPGIVYRRKAGNQAEAGVIYTKDRPFAKDLDRIPFPARELLPNEQYIHYARKKYGYSITTVMSTRGCPFRCEFCSNVVFGGSYRERSPGNVVDEIEAALGLGYDRISFADDVFTMKKERVVSVCEEILRRGLQFQWECLGRVDALDRPPPSK